MRRNKNRAKRRSAVAARRQTLIALRAELALLLLDLGYAIDGYTYRTGMRNNTKDTMKLLDEYRQAHELRYPSA